MTTNGLVVAQPTAEMTEAQRARLVGLIDGKVLNDDVIVIVENGDAYGIDLGFGELTFSDLATVEDRRDSDGTVIYGKSGKPLRHFSVAMELNRLETAQVIGQLLELPDKPGWENGYRRSTNPGQPNRNRRSRSATPAAAPQQQQDIQAMITAAVTAAVAKLVPAQPEPVAKPEPAKPVQGHRKVRRSTAAAVEPEVVTLAEGQIVKLAWNGQLVRITQQASGRIGQSKA